MEGAEKFVLVCGVSATLVKSGLTVAMDHKRLLFWHISVIAVAFLLSLFLKPGFHTVVLQLRKNVGGWCYGVMLPTIRLIRFSLSSDVQGDYVHLVLSELSLLAAVLMGYCLTCDRSARYPWKLLSNFAVCFVTPVVLLAADRHLCIMHKVVVHVLTVAFCASLSKFHVVFPNTFSAGEGVVVMQSVQALLLDILLKLLPTNDSMGSTAYVNKLPDMVELPGPPTFVLVSETIVVTAACMLALLGVGSCYRNWSLQQLLPLTAITAAVGMYVIIAVGGFTWLHRLVVQNHQLLLLLAWWMACVTASLATVFYYHAPRPPGAVSDDTSRQVRSRPQQHQQPLEQQQEQQHRPSAAVRKAFHALAMAVFWPGAMLCPQLLFVASSGALAAFLYVEAIRFLRIQPWGEAVDRMLRIFLDEQDSGCLILTHIYLLVGCSASIWLSSNRGFYGNDVSLYAGIISIGVGDSMASLIGSRYGTHRLPHSRKTVEGTAAGIVAMVNFSLLLQKSCGVASASPEMSLLIGPVLIGLLEAFTKQIDNLMLPLFAFMVLLGK